MRTAEGPASTGWTDRWHDLRGRVLSSPTFQRWAARFPLTRFVAQRRATALFDLCAGFVYSQVLQALVRLRVLEALDQRPRSAEELARQLHLSPVAMERLLDAAVSLRLVERRRGGRYGVGVHGASYLGNPAIAKMVEHHALLYRDLADPVALLRDEGGATELRRFWSYRAEEATADAVARYSELMAASLPLIADDILDAYPLRRHRRLLDVGGGEGAFLEAVARRVEGIELTLFDLPLVAERARARLAREGLDGRVDVRSGNAFTDPIPGPVDVVSLVRILHDHDDEQALALLRSVRSALEPGGLVIIAEPMSQTSGAEAMGDAYFGFYLFAMGQGRPRSPERLFELLAAAGFVRPRLRPTLRPMLARLVSAEAPR